MEVSTRAYNRMAAIVVLLLAAAFRAAIGADANVSPAPAPTSDGTSIDQGIAYVLMLLALVLTYIIH